jgi:hypothetical protein
MIGGEFEAPDLIEAVIGYRQWRLVGDELRSITRDEVWTGPEIVAHCSVSTAQAHAPPGAGCTCGVYARYELIPRTGSAGTADYVAGVVVLWGAIELHGNGMRAERCRIVAFALPLSRWAKRERVQRIARRFGVPAVPSRKLGAIGREHGAPVPRSLRPPRQWINPSAPAGAIPRLVEASLARRFGAAR